LTRLEGDNIPDGVSGSRALVQTLRWRVAAILDPEFEPQWLDRALVLAVLVEMPRPPKPTRPVGKCGASAIVERDGITCDTAVVAPIDTLWTELPSVQFDDAAVEAAVENSLILPLIRALGWPADSVHAKVPAAHRLGRRTQPGRKPEADFVLGDPTQGHVPPNRGYVVVESKRPGEDFSDAREQAESYSFALRALFFLVCDGRRLELWRTGWADEARLLLQVETTSLLEHRATLERHLAPAAVRAYHDQQRPPTVPQEYDLRDYMENVRARARALSAIPRTARHTPIGRPVCDVQIDGIHLPDFVKSGACVFLTSSSMRGKSTVLGLLASAALTPQTPAFLPVLVSAEHIGSSLMESLADALRPQVVGLASVAGVQNLFQQVPPLLLLDDWDKSRLQKLLLDELPLITAAGGASVIASATSCRSFPASLLELDPYSPTERDALVARRGLRARGEHLEANLLPELQTLAREPQFLDLLVAAARCAPGGDERLPPNLTGILVQMLEAVLARTPASPPADAITCICGRLAGPSPFGLADVRSAIGDCGDDWTANQFAQLMTAIGLWERASGAGTYVFANPAWRAYFNTQLVFSDNEHWVRWVREAPMADVEVGLPYAAHQSAAIRRDNAFFREVMRRDVRMHMRSLSARADSARGTHDPVEQAKGVLQSLLSGYEDMVELFAPALRPYLEPWIHAIGEAEAAAAPCIDGGIVGDDLYFAFGLKRDASDDPVHVELSRNWAGRPPRAPGGGYTKRAVNLRLSNLRVDSGRLVATQAALEQIRQIVSGESPGPTIDWLRRERIGEIFRALRSQGYVGSDIAGWTVRELFAWLDEPHRQGTEGWIAGHLTVRRDELDKLILEAVKQGDEDLPLAEMVIERPADASSVPHALQRLLDAAVSTYRAACEVWFPNVKQHFLYGFGPFRFVAYVSAMNVTHWLEPVMDWGTPSSVTLLDSGDRAPDFETAIRDIDRYSFALQREPLRRVTTSFGLLTDWSSPVTREVRALLGKDLDTVTSWIRSAT